MAFPLAGMGVALDHVGVLANDGVTPLSAALGVPSLAGRSMPSGVLVARFGPAECLELVWPGRPGSPVERQLMRRGPGLHHLAVSVQAPLAVAAEELYACGLEFVGAPEPASDGRPSMFVHPRSTGGVLVELIEGPRDDL
jgi:methylmalonyl-CoA/ethylmalonyl-CoA epimerase